MFSWYDFRTTIDDFKLHEYDGSDYEEPLLMEKHCLMNKLIYIDDANMCTNCVYNTNLSPRHCSKPDIGTFLKD